MTTTPLAGFLQDNRRLLLFGGKGGVGKTTLAAATALYRAELTPEKRILLVSTDPAHSLGDSLDQPIGNQLTPIAAHPQLWALELDAAQQLAAFKAQYGAVLKTIANRGTLFDQEDINTLFDLSLPGLDELMAIIEVANITRSRQYDLVILDTAPTGHTLRLLGMPQVLKDWLKVLDLMLSKHRYMVSVLGRYRPDETDAFLKDMSNKLDLLRQLLSDNNTTEFVPVMIPEAMSIAETERLVASLRALGVRTQSLVVNHIVETGNCPFCARRSAEQGRHLAEIERLFPSHNVLYAPQQAHEVRGQAALQRYTQALRPAQRATISSQETSAPSATPVLQPSPSPSDVEPSAIAQGLAQRTLILFGGKGGVGKTTIAAATAVHLAQQHAGHKTLLFSTDPAHSLSDSLGQTVGDHVVAVEDVPGLFALEMDASILMEELKHEYQAQIQEVFDGFLSTTFDAPFDRQVMEELLALAPPGLDELMALMKIMDFVEQNAFDRYVLDLAPTGHALRFLEMPGMARQWFIAFFRLLLKYQGLVSLTRVAELLRSKSKQLRRVEQILVDQTRCEFVAVTIAEKMALLETARLLERLTALSVTWRWVVANMIVPPNDCSFCRAMRDQQQGYLADLGAEAFRPTRTDGGGLIQVPLFHHEVRGVAGLREVAAVLFGETENGR